MSINVDGEKRAYEILVAAGLTPEGAAAMIGNMEAESDGFWAWKVEYLCINRLREYGIKDRNGNYYTQDSYTSALDNGGISREEFLHPLPGKQYGYGYVQWTSPNRKAGLWDLAHKKGVSMADESMQLEYLLYELKNSYPGVLKVLKTTHSIREASDIVLKKFESPANTGESVCQSRAARGQKFYDNYVKGGINMAVTANDIIKIMQGWVGLSRAKGTHKTIIDTYNSHKPLARGYKVTYSDAYCDTTVSAAFIKANAVSLIGGTECGVEEHIKIFKNAGIWKEDGTLTPEPGWIACYNWDDGTQPNDGYADHIGVVESVNKSQKTFVVIEGNMDGGVVGRRTVSVGWGYIRGFAAPKYSAAGSTPAPAQTPNTNLIGSCTPTLHTFLKGAQDKQIKAIQVLLKRQGFVGKDGKKLSVDGKIGDNTAYAIEQFQRKHGMTNINFGTVASKTWELLINNAK